jgi:hypothetical protein
MTLFLIYYHILLLVCSLTGSLLVRRDWPLWSKLLVILSWVTLVVEGIAWVCHAIHMTNAIYYTWYSLWAFLETLTVLYILSREVILASVKRLHRILMILLPVGVALYFILWPPFAYIVLFYMLLEVIAACAVLIDILKDVSDEPMHGKPIFWLATGMLFFCSLFMVVYSMGRLINTLPRSAYVPLGCFANTFMYGGIIACFIVLGRRGRQQQGSKILHE